MKDRDSLSRELGTDHDSVEGVELTDQVLDEAAGGAEWTIIKSESTIINDA